MKKRESRSITKKSAARKTAGANHRTLARRTPTGWRAALERNLRAQGYSLDEARELVEIAAS
jgi:hypothetical protein